MARRTVLTSRQRSDLFALPQREADLLRHYTLSDEDLQNIGARRRPRNKLGFALQLCVLRHSGRPLAPGEFLPPAVVGFIGRQLDLDGDELADYAVRSETRHEHLAELRRLYGFRSFSGGAARELVERLRDEAEQAQSNEDLVRRFIEACRDTRTILPATTTIPPHRITRLRRQGERYFADGLRELPDNRRLAILAVCAVEWEMFLVDAVVETRDRVVGRTYREAFRACEAQLGDETAAVRESLRAFAELGRALIGARDTGEALDTVIADGPAWVGLGDLVAKATALASTAVSDPLNHVFRGLQPFPPLHAANERWTSKRRRRPSPCWKRSTSCAATARRGRPASCGRIRSGGGCCAPNPVTALGRRRCCSTYGTRSAPATSWLARSRRYGDIRKALLAAPAVLPAPASPHDWLAERRFALDEGLRRLAAAARAGAIAGGSIEEQRPPRREDGNRRAGRGR